MICLYTFEDIENENENENIYKIDNEQIDNNDLCVFCLEGNILPFYKYDDKKLIHNCECKPVIHKDCFYDFLSKKQNCIICCEMINKKISRYDTFKINLRQSILNVYSASFYLLLIYILGRFILFILFNFFIYFFYD